MAKAAVVEQVQERVQDHKHSEARFLAFTEVYYNGVIWHLTMREGVTGTAIVEFLENLAKVTAWVGKQKGWSFKPGGPHHSEAFTAPVPTKRAAAKKPAKPAAPAPPAPPTTTASSPPPPPPPPPAPSTLGATSLPLATAEGASAGDVIDVKLMSRHMSDDGEREYYRVKGGRMMKFGVRCWPEVAITLAAFGIEAPTMTLGQTYNLADFDLVAHYIRNEEGKVSKVVKFQKKE